MTTGDQLTRISEPGTNAEMPGLPGVISPEFKLKSKDDGEAMPGALKKPFGSTFDQDVEHRVVRKGTTWSFITGDFFKKFSGDVFETDAEGKVTKVTRSLGIEG